MSKRIAFCIGAPMSLSSWLYTVLNTSNQIFIPCVKEVRHFYGSRSDMEKRRVYELLSSESSPDQRRWLDRWMREENTDKQYLDNMLSASDKEVALDISPIYSIAPIDVIRRIYNAVGQTNVLYILRNPIEREYSHIDLEYHLHGCMKVTLPTKEYFRRFSKPIFIQRSLYSDNLDRWRKVFGENNVKVMFYDDIRESQLKFIKKIYELLGCDFSKEDLASYNSDYKEYRAPQPGPNKSIKRLLAARYYSEIYELANKYSTPCKEWLKEAENYLDLFDSNTIASEKPLTLYEFEKSFIKKMISLGDNCEFGFFQRELGIEESSLFRWAITPIDKLLFFLEDDGRNLFHFSNLTPYSPGMVLDNGTGFCFHSQIRSEKNIEKKLEFIDKKQRRLEIHNNEYSKITYLWGKFFNTLKKESRIYVIKHNKTSDTKDIHKLLSLLKSFNKDNKLLWVVQANFDDLTCQVEEPNKDLFKATISRFAPYTEANNALFLEWLEIARQLLIKTVHPGNDYLVKP